MRIVVISTTAFAEHDRSPLELLERNGYKILTNPYGRKITPVELLGLAKDAVGLIAGTESIEEPTLLKLPKLKMISRCGVGLDNVDLAAAKRNNIKVANTPDAPTLAVAELTVGLILNLLRKITIMDSAIRRNHWQKLTGNLLLNKKVGIIGFGRIGKKVAQLLKSFGCQIAYTDPNISSASGELENMSKEELLTWADIITIHVSCANTILGSDEFKRLKKGAWIVNVSRGEAVEEPALLKALQDNDISGAAIDVFAQEPYSGKLREFENVILTPHIGSYAQEARIKMELEAAQNLIEGLKEGDG